MKSRMDDILTTIEKAGSDGIKIRELVKSLIEKWSYKLSTIKGYKYNCLHTYVINTEITMNKS